MDEHRLLSVSFSINQMSRNGCVVGLHQSLGSSWDTWVSECVCVRGAVPGHAAWDIATQMLWTSRYFTVLTVSALRKNSGLSTEEQKTHYFPAVVPSHIGIKLFYPCVVLYSNTGLVRKSCCMNHSLEFHKIPLREFWLETRSKFQGISEMVRGTLLPLRATYLYEVLFSVTSDTK